MKVSTSRAALFTELQTVTRAASTRSAVQALSGVQLTAKGGAIELRATDMEIGLRVPLEGEVVRDGAVVLPARLLVDVVRALSGDSISLELRASEQDVEIVAGSATFHIRTLRLEDFPPFPEPEGDGKVEVPGPAFVETVLKVARSASRDETRPVLTGILVSASESDLRMVATDSYRLSVKETKLESPLQGSFEANVPARALQELTRIVQTTEAESLSVSVRTNQVIFEAGGVVLSSRLIDGQFPNYRQLLPDAYEHELPLAGTEITEVVRRISLLAQKNAPLRLAFAEGELTVSARTPDVGEAQESLPVPFQGEPLEIGFNPEFLRDGLEAVESGDVLLKLISPLRPGLIEAADGSGFQYLLMPIRLNDRRRRRAIRAGRMPAGCTARSAVAAQLPLLRGGGGAAGPGADRGHGPERRRQDEPARGDLLRLHRALVPDGERARGGALRRRRHAAGARRRARRRDAPHHRRLRAGRGEAPAGRRRHGRPADRRGRAPAGLGLPPRPPGAGARRAGAAARAPRPGDRRAVARPRGHAPRATPPRSASATRCWRRSAPAAPAAARCRRGTSSSPATASPWPPTGPPRSRALAEPFATHAEALGLEGGAELTYRPRSRAETAEALAAELAERTDSDLERGFTGHGPHRDELVLKRAGRELRTYGSRGQQRLGLLALLLAERGVLAAERGAAPLMLLDDVTSELDSLRRERLVEALREGGGQSVIATTDLGHVPGGDDEDVVHLTVAEGTVAEAGADGPAEAVDRIAA